ncbi:unnamed protein product [Ascophyllum nodosum]
MRDTGASAIDFTLHDVEGQAWNLHEVLEGSDGKPVALIWGMSTCPAYQGLDSQGSSYRWAYWDEYDLVESHSDRAIFVHIYGPEPHPESPEVNFDSGKLLPNYWSISRQARSYETRLQSARNIRGTTHPNQVILPDYLPDNPYSPLNQPVWCSYANAARSAVLISQLGTIFYQQEWLNTDELGIAIDAYWEQEGQGTWEGHGNGSPKGTRLAKKARAGTVLNNLQEKREHEEEGPTSP